MIGKGFTACQIKDLSAPLLTLRRNGGWERLRLDGFAKANPSALLLSNLFYKFVRSLRSQRRYRNASGGLTARPAHRLPHSHTPTVGSCSLSAVELSSSFAFTLAEVLITLAIIGIVASLTIPSVVKNYKAVQYETALKKAESEINRAIYLMRYDLGEDIKKSNFQTNTFKPLFMKYFNVIEDCNWSNCYNKATPKYMNYANNAPATNTIFSEGNFVVKKGMLFMIDNDSSDLQVSVDINGYKKAPNRWGYDLFTFYLTDEGKFVPAGAPNTARTSKNTYCSKESTNGSNGIACAYWALTDKDYFKNLP